LLHTAETRDKNQPDGPLGLYCMPYFIGHEVPAVILHSLNPKFREIQFIFTVSRVVFLDIASSVDFFARI